MVKTDITTAEKQIQEILKKHNLKLGYDLSFPMYKQLPIDVQLALKILARHGMKIVFTLKEASKKK